MPVLPVDILSRLPIPPGESVAALLLVPRPEPCPAVPDGFYAIASMPLFGMVSAAGEFLPDTDQFFKPRKPLASAMGSVNKTASALKEKLAETSEIRKERKGK